MTLMALALKLLPGGGLDSSQAQIHHATRLGSRDSDYLDTRPRRKDLESAQVTTQREFPAANEPRAQRAGIISYHGFAPLNVAD